MKTKYKNLKKFFEMGMELSLFVVMIFLVSCGGKNPLDNNDNNNQQVVIPLPAENPLNVFIKNVGTTPAPNWVKPGVRLAFFGGASWLYTNGMPPSRQLSDSGSGYVVVDVISVTNDIVVMNFRYYIIADFNNGPPKYVSSSSYTGPPSVGFNYYVHPQILRSLLTLNSPEVKAVRMNYSLGGKNYQAIRVQYETQNDYLAYTFDETSGILLTNSMRVQPGREAQVQFVARRQVNLPWNNKAVPGWINTLNQLKYQGLESVTQPGAPPFNLAATVTAKIQNRGTNWLEYLYSYSSPNANVQTKLVSGTNQVGGLWINHDVFATLQQGQIIDSDDIMNVQTSVAYIGNLNNNKKVVIIRELGNQQQIDYTYDYNTGILYRITISDLIMPYTGTIKTVDVVLVEQN